MRAAYRLDQHSVRKNAMIQHLSPSLRSTLYALRGGFLVRPLVIVLTLAGTARVARR